jgi:hypothetical protein
MNRKIKAIDAETGKPIEIGAESIRSGPIRNDALPEDLLRRIHAVHQQIRDVYDVPLEQFEITFMRDQGPEAEVQVWESVALGFEKVCRSLPSLDRRMVLRTLLAYSMEVLTAEELADQEVRRVVELIQRG